MARTVHEVESRFSRRPAFGRRLSMYAITRHDAASPSQAQTTRAKSRLVAFQVQSQQCAFFALAQPRLRSPSVHLRCSLDGRGNTRKALAEGLVAFAA
jgi:hypothetical protein